MASLASIQGNNSPQGNTPMVEVSAANGVKSNGQVVDGNGQPVTTGVSTTPVSSNNGVTGALMDFLKKKVHNIEDAGATSAANTHESTDSPTIIFRYLKI